METTLEQLKAALKLAELEYDKGCDMWDWGHKICDDSDAMRDKGNETRTKGVAICGKAYAKISELKRQIEGITPNGKETS